MARGWPTIVKLAILNLHLNRELFGVPGRHRGRSVVTEDVELIQATLEGQVDAFGALVRKYQDRLFHTLVHVTGSHVEAEDVVQEAFVKSFINLPTFKGNSTFYTWLYRIALNTCISRRRQKQPEVSMEAHRQNTGYEPQGTSEPPSGTLERQERADQVHAALEKLSDEHREVLVLREMEGFCYETISQMLDLPIGTVRSRLHRGRTELRGLLKSLLEQPS